MLQCISLRKFFLIQPSNSFILLYVMQLQCKLSVMKVGVWTLSQCMINVSMMKMQLETGRCCSLLSRGTCTISANIIVHCKRLQEYVKSIVKDDKNVLKPETILQKNHQDSKWCIQNIIISTAQQDLVIVNFQINFRLISISQWVTLNDWGFSLITVTQSWDLIAEFI